MAGRGCTVIVQLLNPSVGDGNEAATGNGVEEISLPVALHSPLFVFKERLQELCGIDVPDQVLILCDLTDPDRNNDLLLSQDYTTIKLRDCGFKSGSVLTLHALGYVDGEVHASDTDVIPRSEGTFANAFSCMCVPLHCHYYVTTLTPFYVRSPQSLTITITTIIYYFTIAELAQKSGRY